MSGAAAQQIPPTDPDEKPLDGNTGAGQQEEDNTDPLSTDNNEDAGTPVVPPPDSEVNKMITDAMAELDQLESQRSDINSQISAVIERLESKGVNRHAFRYARKVLGMSDKQKAGLDLSYMLVRQAGGDPVQTDWIEEEGQG